MMLRKNSHECRRIGKSSGKKNLLTYQKISNSFGKKNRQDCENHIQKLERSGGSLAEIILDGQRGRPKDLHPEIAYLIAKLWERDSLDSTENTC
jgi:hypothetical protein